MKRLSLYIPFVLIICCGQRNKNATAIRGKELINEKGTTLQARFNTPPGYERKAAGVNTFAYYLRNLPLKPIGSKVKYYDGTTKQNEVYAAVIDFDIGNKNLQQCADAVMRLRAEYLYSIKQYDKISFHFTNGFAAGYAKWMQGYRIEVKGNDVAWYKAATPSNSYSDFHNFMDKVYTYCGSLSLSRELKPKNIKDIQPGDVFIHGGTPGHAEIVLDVAENKAGEKVFILAQSYMPAQNTQVLKNMEDEDLSPWYSAGITGSLVTPEWTFDMAELMTW